MMIWNLENRKNYSNNRQKLYPLDTGAGILFPYFDPDLECLYLGGKGDGNIKYFEFLEGELHYTNDFRTTVPGKGYGFLPKRFEKKI